MRGEDMPKNITEIKELMEERLGDTVIITVQMGRKKKKERRGILRETYRSVFVVDLDQEQNDFDCVSYSYRDILTNSIEIDFEK